MKKPSGVVTVEPRSSSTGGSGSSDKKKSSCPSSKKQRGGGGGGGGGAPSSSHQQQQQQQHKFPVEPVVISVVNKPREIMNHSYRDFSNVPAEIGYEHVTNIADMTFSQKVHDILSQPEYKTWINWHSHGRSFKIFVPMYFERTVCEKYFGHKRYSSFLRQLNNFGFKHISKGPDRNSYYHEFFLEGRPHLCKYMPLCKDARRLIPDPQNEPDFYTISAQYPLKGEQSGVGKNVPEEELKPAAKQQPEHSTVTLSCDAPAVNSTMIPSLSAVIPAATRPAESMAPSLEPPPPMTLASQMESVAPLRMAACILPPANAFAAAGSSAHVAAAGCVSSANLISSPTAAASTLGCRLVSEVSWLLQQLPPAKVHRSATATTPSSYHSAAATAVPDPAVWLCALDVAQARRQHQEAAATASLARQHQQLLQQEEAALIAAVEAAQVRQEAALLAAVQQRKQQIVSRLLLGVDARVQCSSSNSSGLNATGGNDNVQDTSALLDYIRRMQQHDG